MLSISGLQVSSILEHLSFISSYQGHTAQKTKFSIKYFVSKCDQICSALRIWSHLLKKSLMENFSAMTLLNLVSEVEV